ncbi:hypothetical protein [Lacrimispora defluvii]|uniref:Sporulation initiation factor Spo0A C-terminal domain-containing protein n=1 Tax=Lacrimispora defluvii TaxID=2719233 RepID=A0ABX1VY86_9FIRM|nr:hypothetical protein [Lacrimispora defluvii]NNJ32812.1 hypothetical protein [Lacrimispora defluvii]
MLSRKKVESAFKTIAEREGVSVAYVRAQIQEAIEAAKTNPDPKTKQFWAAIPHQVEHPSPEDVVCFIIDNISKEQ